MRILFAVLSPLLVLLTSCGSRSVSASRPMERPQALRYAFSSTAEDPDAALTRLEPLRRYLESELRVRVEATRTSGYGTVIEAFRSRKVDVASISPFSYVLASEKVPIEAIVMRGNQDGSAGAYTGVLAVPGKSPIQSVEDLKRMAKNLTISFVDPASTSGYLVQAAYLQSVGLDPEKSFRKVVFSTNQIASLMTLKAGKVDVAASMERLVNGYLKTGKLAPGDIRVIWTSPPLPNQPIAITKEFPPEFREEVRQAFLNLEKKAPAAFAAMQRRYTAYGIAAAPLVRADDAMFDGLRRMARSVPNLSLLER